MTVLSMYESVMGPRFRELAPAVQAFHRLTGTHELHGRVRTAAPGSVAARLLAWFLGTPAAATSGEIHFRLEASQDCEIWVRHFPHQTMMSRLQCEAGQVMERLGVARLHFALQAVDGRLEMRLVKLRFLGIPCPRWALPVVIAEESGHADELHFNVSAALPFVGQVAAYSGYLTVPSGVAK